MSAETDRRCGMVGIIGAPNAGKSTLVNRLVGSKVTIVSPKVQTTRTRVMGILTEGDTQIILVDTPGIFAPKRRLDRAMVSAAWQGARDADAVLLLVDIGKGRINDDTRAIIEKLKEQKRRVALVLNKIDMLARERLLSLTAELNAMGDFSDVYMISALKGDGVDKLKADLAARMPQGPWLFGDEQLSDMPMRLLAAEITREQIFLQLGDELPYDATVETEEWQERDDGSAKVSQVIYVRRDTQKAIVLGAGGQRIKKIGQAARLELEAMLDRRIHMTLFVKVRDNWGNDPARFSHWGLDFNA